MDDKNNINQSNNNINGPFGREKEKNDINIYRQNPYVQEREKNMPKLLMEIRTIKIMDI